METIPAIKACAVCTQEFTYPPNNPRALYCSDACREQGRPSRVSICACGNKKWRYSETCRVCMNSARYARTRDVALQTREQRHALKLSAIRADVQVRYQSRTFKASTCRVCAAPFISLNVDVTCSSECQQAHRLAARQEGKHRRRALERSAYVAPVNRRKVFEADGYKCHLCSKKTDPNKLPPHPRASTIDHVIPLARGGTHEPANCRTACFLCNSAKGDRGGGEQMLLFAV